MAEQPATPPTLDAETALDLLRSGTIDVQGQLIDASNATLFCEVSRDGLAAACVYKPVAGERPLWDFPSGTLAGREVAAYAVSVATGWDLVPPTVLRDGPFGPGMVQLWIDVDETVDLVALSRSDHPDLRRMAVLDAVINNADRKGGHLLPTPDGRIRGVDHGVTFHVHDKLRTVLWRWRGDPLTDEATVVLERLAAELAAREGWLSDELGTLLNRREVAATAARVDRLLAAGAHPLPSEDRPPVPWPPF
jgi:uncharacterized repeat protein (TIGR03843 family)